MKNLKRWIGVALVGGSLFVASGALAQGAGGAPEGQGTTGQDPSGTPGGADRMDQAPGEQAPTPTEDQKKRDEQRRKQGPTDDTAQPPQPPQPPQPEPTR